MPFSTIEHSHHESHHPLLPSLQKSRAGFIPINLLGQNLSGTSPITKFMPNSSVTGLKLYLCTDKLGDTYA